jgi:hypothetical protein
MQINAARRSPLDTPAFPLSPAKPAMLSQAAASNGKGMIEQGSIREWGTA